MKTIINEDFKDFKLDEFPYDTGHTAIGEYHYFMPEGYTGNFYDPISLHQWRSMGGSWMVTEAFGKHYMEQNRGDNAKGHFESVSAILVHKETLFAPYNLSFELRLFETNKLCGMCFNYIHNRKYDAVSIDGSKLVVYHRDQETVTVYGEIDYEIDSLTTAKIELKFEDLCNVYIDNKLMISLNIDFIPKTKIAFIGKSACRFSDLKLTMTNENAKLHEEMKNKEELRIKKLQEKYSPLECIKKIDLKNFGSGREFRMGYDKDNKPVFILMQHQKRMYRDSFVRLSCITAFDLDGNVRWQYGEPHNVLENTLISCDLPCQIADLNNDGLNEVIFAMDFMVYIVSLDTGKILKTMPTPYVKNDPLVKDYPYDRLNPDGMRVADFEGKGYKCDFILKDRYHNVWAISATDFHVLWRYNHNNTGHFPYIYDFDKDGHDEMLVGYDMVDHDGKILWSLPINSDHTDEIIYAKTNKNEPARFYLASGNEGFNIVNMDGSIYKSNLVGHAQRISVSSYDKTRDDLQVAVTSFWGADRLVYLYDSLGNLLREREMLGNGNLVSPVAYDGENELILANASKAGGLLDANLDTVVMFPDDGHPKICSEVLDIDNDGVDEIICWDMNQMWIYKAKNYKTGAKYDRYPDTGFSNYRGEYLIRK